MGRNIKEIGWFLLSPFIAVGYAVTLPLFVPGILLRLFREGEPPNDD